MGKAQAIRFGVDTANAVLRIAFAPLCASCRSPLTCPLDGCICERCWAAIEPAPRVPWPGGSITAAAAGGDYVGSLRQIVHAFKYDGRRSLAQPLAWLMRAHGGDVLDDAACVIPVPLHPWRRLQRGFNQSSDLASALGLPVRSILWRVRATAAQAALTGPERRRNVSGAFGVSPLVSRRVRDALRGQVVVLVDDVRTTGATLNACADGLATIGVREVRALTVAVRALGGR